MGSRKIDLKRTNKVKRRGWFSKEKEIESPKEFKILDSKGNTVKKINENRN